MALLEDPDAVAKPPHDQHEGVHAAGSNFTRSARARTVSCRSTFARRRASAALRCFFLAGDNAAATLRRRVISRLRSSGSLDHPLLRFPALTVFWALRTGLTFRPGSVFCSGSPAPNAASRI